MRERGSGWILNISSHAALHPDKKAGGHGSSVYGMCKAALERFTTGLAQEVYSEGVGVNVISPGLVATPGVMHHKLINESNEDRVTPVEHMAGSVSAPVLWRCAEINWANRLRRSSYGRVCSDGAGANLVTEDREWMD